jgi:glucose dehydrogenase
MKGNTGSSVAQGCGLVKLMGPAGAFRQGQEKDQEKDQETQERATALKGGNSLYAHRYLTTRTGDQR